MRTLGVIARGEMHSIRTALAALGPRTQNEQLLRQQTRLSSGRSGPSGPTMRCRRREERIVTSARRSLSLLEELREERVQEERRELEVQTVEFDSPVQIVLYPDPRLRAPNARVKLPAKGLEELARQMFKVMYMDDGVGLAAPQVGVNIQMMVFNPEGMAARGDKSQEMVLVNPEIIKRSKKTIVNEEGCLSFPRILGDVERPAAVKIKAQGLKGEKIELKLDGWVSRIFQHEFDHLQGVLFFERMAAPVLQTIRPQLIELEETFVQKNPGVAVQRIT